MPAEPYKPKNTMALKSIKYIPKLRVSNQIKVPEFFDPQKTSAFHYEAKSHKRLPHVVKFSGGKTSGMLLFILLEAGLLKAERGDVVVFNNTSAEHPATYEFVRQCKRIIEKRYKIPFFWVEYQTYEDARQGEYIRLSSFKLVNTEAYSEDNPHGYHWRGEVFEEMLAHKGYVPTLFQRTCTQSLKLESSRLFLREWLANKEETERLGHFGKASRIDNKELYARHKKNKGKVPEDVLLAKKAFLKQCNLARDSQKWLDYSDVVIPFTNKELEGKVYGRKANFSEGGIEYISFVGIRHDEMQRVIKIQRRNAGGPDAEGFEGEHVYMPLVSMKITDEDVQAFWEKQTLKLELNKDDNLSNCTYCFLKGTKKLLHIKSVLQANLDNELTDTPCDIGWWAKIEEKYGRDMKAEGRETKSVVPNDFIGFFGASSGLSYRFFADADKVENVNAFSEDGLPCDCTD